MNTKKTLTFGLMTVSLALLCLVAPRGAAAASLIEDPLTDEEIAALSFDARTLYTQAVADMDHVAYDPALEELCKAAKLEPKNAHLQMIAARAHQLRGRTKSGTEASQLYDKALELIEVPLSDQSLPAETRDRCEKMKASIEAEKEKLAKLDADRAALAESIRKDLGNDAQALTPTPTGDFASASSGAAPKVSSSSSSGARNKALNSSKKNQTTRRAKSSGNKGGGGKGGGKRR